jgi:ATP-dependent DNA helicase RecQ
LTTAESAARRRDLACGGIRLLYVSPERLLMPEFFSGLARWNVRRIAIDEAHCISEWGHDFRPEYRRLAEVRDAFPDLPIIALTATATVRVQEDIVRLLHLRDPARFVASFNRSNLSYAVRPKEKAAAQILAFVQAHGVESGIVYCGSRKTTEAVAEKLNRNGVAAVPYHAGLSTAERTRNQDRFVTDDVQVVCATIAFGMGINKPNVRFICHADLPKSIEGYYQETGRAGRDGLPADCLLLFRAGDAVQQRRFIEEKSDPKEREVAKRQLGLMVHYAESADCRRKVLLDYFGEGFERENCDGCDNCRSPRPTFDGTLAAQKFLSCVYRIRQKGGFATGVAHVIDVLRGRQTDKIRQWGHETLSTYGIGKDHSAAEWREIARQLMRHGWIAQTEGTYPVIHITPVGFAGLTQRKMVTLTQLIAPKSSRKEKVPRASVTDTAGDQALFDRLRARRRQIAQDRGVPPYIIFSDVTLKQMAARLPRTDDELLSLTGVGPKKLADFGKAFLEEIRAFRGE